MRTIQSIALLVLATLFVSEASAVTFTVGPPGSGKQFTEICIAVFAAAQNPGVDVIEVDPGTYRPFHLGSEKVVIKQADPLMPRPVVDFNLATAPPLVTGFCPALSPTSLLSGVVRIDGGQGPETIIEGLEVLNGVAFNDGAGFFIEDSSPIIRDSIVSGNMAGRDGGGFFILNAPDVVIDNTLVIDNEAGRDGGGIAALNSTVTVRNNSALTMNKAGSQGGGLFATAVEADTLRKTVVSQTEVSNNTALSGGGINIQGGSNGFTLDIRQSRVLHNSAEDNGGGILVHEGARVDMDQTAVIDNSASIHGGGVFVQETQGSNWSNSTFADNTAGMGDGGGLFMLSHKAVDTFKNALITTNHADNSRGGGVFIDGAFPEFFTTTIAENTAGMGGGVFTVLPTMTPSIATIDSSIVWANSPDGFAGNPPAFSFSDVQGGIFCATCISADPRFVTGTATTLQPKAAFFLDQANSPAIDAANTATINLSMVPYPGTTNVLVVDDGAPPDMGFHYNGTPVPVRFAVLQSSVPPGPWVPAVNGIVTFTLQTEPPKPNTQRFLVMSGSFSGTVPGFTIDGLTLPLNVDDYTRLLLNNGTAVFPGGTTVMANVAGQATILLDETPFAGLTGFTVNHAFAVIELNLISGAFFVVDVSQPIAFQF